MGKYKELKKEVAELRQIINQLHPENLNIQFEQVNELPEKWCVKRNNKNANQINKWLNRNGNRYTEKYGYVSSTEFVFCELPKGYEKITFDTFKRLVLKEEPKEEQPIDWSVPGQLVKAESEIVRTTGVHFQNRFEGFIVQFTNGATDYNLDNCYSSDWAKSCFTLCTEPITIQNQIIN